MAGLNRKARNHLFLVLKHGKFWCPTQTGVLKPVQGLTYYSGQFTYLKNPLKPYLSDPLKLAETALSKALVFTNAQVFKAECPEIKKIVLRVVDRKGKEEPLKLKVSGLTIAKLQISDMARVQKNS